MIGPVGPAIMRTHTGRRRSLHEELLVREPRVVAVPLGWPLIGLDEVQLRDLADYPLVINSFPGSANLGPWEEGGQPVVEVEVDTIDDRQSCIAAGVGIGVTPASTAWIHAHADISHLPLRGAPVVPVYLPSVRSSKVPFSRRTCDLGDQAQQQPVHLRSTSAGQYTCRARSALSGDVMSCCRIRKNWCEPCVLPGRRSMDAVAAQLGQRTVLPLSWSRSSRIQPA